jgi:hypothetical protein
MGLMVLALSACTTALEPTETASEQALTQIDSRPDLDLRTTVPGDLARFRRLRSTDFSADNPLTSTSVADLGLGLHASLSILVSPYATLGFRPLDGEEEQVELRAKNVHYMAVLDRRHSWLSPELTPSQRRYVLAYAYARFSLYEQAARRLTQAATELLDTGYQGTDRLALVQQFTNAMSARLKQELASIETQAQKLERATALTIDGDALLKWVQRLEQQLQANENLSYTQFLAENFPGALGKSLQHISFGDIGLYDPGPCEGMVLKLQSLGHFGCVSSQAPQFIQSTQKIPLRKGVTFGLRFAPQGLDEGQWAELDVVTVYPEPGVRPSGANKLFASNIAQILATGAQDSPANLYLYQLTENWELLPGIWKFEFYSQGRKIAEQAFELVR